ncbi:DUF5522 domain-containing protein [Pedobacter psychrodurus]|uniref:DUF5522 domain-containing protein n=1 Tax=Pedobacter psychrodurus TaxID=2530456 RepID=UPI00103D6309|nr:DUF5522 domain-containing protein [Pedobacter psychrodurus]
MSAVRHPELVSGSLIGNIMKEGEDFYFNEDGLMVFTESYHLKRGYCCKNKCRHCPWGYGKKKEKK